MADTAPIACPRCKANSPPRSVQCMSCGALFPKEVAPARGTVAGLLHGLGRILALVALVALVGVFGVGFWALSRTDLNQVKAVWSRGDETQPPEPADEAAAPAPTTAPPAVILVQSGGGTLRITAGDSGRLAMGHLGHHVRVSAEVSGAGIVLHTSRQPLVFVSDGESVTLACPERRLQRTSEGGAMTLKQVDCPDTVNVTVTMEAASPS